MITIRPAKFDEIGIIADFQIRLARETENVILDKGILSAGIETLLKDPAKGTYYAAALDGKVIGCFLITYEWSEWRNSTIWWLQSVYVMPSNRQQGVFKKMHDHIIGLISGDPAITGLRFYVDKSNSRAQKAYQSLGMNGDHYTVFEWMKK